MVDEVYKKLNDQVWEIPTSSQYVSDSDSPLSLISSSMPSPTLTPSNAMLLSSMIPLFSDQQEKAKLSYPSRSSTDTIYYNGSVETSTTTTTSCIEFTTRNVLENDNNQEVVKNHGSAMRHENVIAYNHAIACIKPQSVSIKWSTSGANIDCSTVSSTLINIKQKQSDGSQTSSNSISHELNQDEFNIISASSDSPSFRVTIPGKIERDLESQSSTEYSFQVEKDFSSSQESNDDVDTISFTDIISDIEYKNTEDEPNLTETDTSREESDALDTPPPVETSKKRKKTDAPKYKSNAIASSNTTSNNSSFTSGTAKKRRLTAVVGTSRDNNNSNRNKHVNSPSNAKPPPKKKRTVTSYDAQTSQYLKSVFFEVYSKQSKLSKEQRAIVQEKTGLPSRNITYWFSNHKRRFQDTLEIYRKAVIDSEGSINCYDDFIQWRKDNELPEGTQ